MTNNLINDFYIIQIKDYTKTKYIIWYTNSYYDGILLFNNKVIVFSNIEKLNEYIKIKDIKIVDMEELGNSLYDFIYLKNYIKGKKVKYDYHLFLDFWNLFDDISYSIQKNRIKKEISIMYKNHKKAYKHISRIYDKVFVANNLDVITPKDKFYVPIWKKLEIKTLRRIMKYGLELFENSIIEISEEDSLVNLGIT